MSEYERYLRLPELLQKKSHFLFGPRQTGKTWMILHQFEASKKFDLLETDTFLEFQRFPQRLREQVTAEDELVIIDEIQKVPGLLDEVHLLIERDKIHFLLTGSSARKLRRGGVNLLGGRARSLTLHPLVSAELGSDFSLKQAMERGTLPPIYQSDDPRADLLAYVRHYLQEEIAAEALTRNIPAFSRFLQVAALCNGQILNYTKIANDAQVARSTAQEYFGILRDTLLGFDLPAWRESVKRKASRTAKFYFFDVGVVRAIQGRENLNENSADYGEALETYLFHELKSYSDYHGLPELSYWRSTTGLEVDFILANRVAIEVKSTRLISERQLKGLRALREEGVHERLIVVCNERRKRYLDGIEIFPYRDFLDALWSHELVE